MKLEELTLMVWRMAFFATFWAVFWFAAYRVWAWRWWWRVPAVLVWMFLGALASGLRFAPRLGVAGLPDLLLWPVVLATTLMGGGQISSDVRFSSPHYEVPAGIRVAELVLGVAMAVQCYMAWRFLLKRGAPKPRPEETGNIAPPPAPDSVPE